MIRSAPGCPLRGIFCSRSAHCRIRHGLPPPPGRVQAEKRTKLANASTGHKGRIPLPLHLSDMQGLAEKTAKPTDQPRRVGLCQVGHPPISLFTSELHMLAIEETAAAT